MGVGVGVVEKIKSGRRKRKSALILKREIGERDKEAPRAKNKKVNLDLEKVSINKNCYHDQEKSPPQSKNPTNPTFTQHPLI